MAVTCDWGTQTFFVPKADLTPVAGTLYECDTNWLRQQIAALMDDSNGIVFVDAFRHNTEVLVAGTTFARTIEIINGFKLEFEDGQYTVRLTGSNNNFFDVANGILVQNQVQIISQNSAGLVAVEGVEIEAKVDLLLEKIQQVYNEVL